MTPHTLIVNGCSREIAAAPFWTLADALRSLGLTGTKIGCATGDCGACTIHCDGKPLLACQIPATETTGVITTIEGLQDVAADALRRAFTEQGAFQCGFCTSGQLMRAHALLDKAREMDDRGLARALSGNICRCTGYAGIIRAVRAAAAYCNAQGTVAETGSISRSQQSETTCAR